ncbi:unnamed protein product [Absidia cylindrospora]
MTAKKEKLNIYAIWHHQKYAQWTSTIWEFVENEIPFRDIKAVILEIVCRYLYYKWQYEGSTTEIPEFKIDPEVVLETLMTADFLEC